MAEGPKPTLQSMIERPESIQQSSRLMLSHNGLKLEMPPPRPYKNAKTRAGGLEQMAFEHICDGRPFSAKFVQMLHPKWSYGPSPNSSISWTWHRVRKMMLDSDDPELMSLASRVNKPSDAIVASSGRTLKVTGISMPLRSMTDIHGHTLEQFLFDRFFVPQVPLPQQRVAQRFHRHPGFIGLTTTSIGRFADRIDAAARKSDDPRIRGVQFIRLPPHDQPSPRVFRKMGTALGMSYSRPKSHPKRRGRH